MGQPGFFDLDRRLEAISAKGDPLETIKTSVPWEDFRSEIEAVTETKPEERKSNAGRKPYDTILKLKVVVLQSLYNLSDEQTEFMIRDRLSFMRFLDLGLEDPVPDATTIWLFREALIEAQLIDKLFDRFGQHLAAKGYIARGGQLEADRARHLDVEAGQLAILVDVVEGRKIAVGQKSQRRTANDRRLRRSLLGPWPPRQGFSALLLGEGRDGDSAAERQRDQGGEHEPVPPPQSPERDRSFAHPMPCHHPYRTVASVVNACRAV